MWFTFLFHLEFDKLSQKPRKLEHFNSVFLSKTVIGYDSYVVGSSKYRTGGLSNSSKAIDRRFF